MQWHCHLHPIDSALHYLGMPVTCRIWHLHSTSLFLTSFPPQFLPHSWPPQYPEPLFVPSVPSFQYLLVLQIIFSGLVLQHVMCDWYLFHVHLPIVVCPWDILLLFEHCLASRLVSHLYVPVRSTYTTCQTNICETSICCPPSMMNLVIDCCLHHSSLWWWWWQGHVLFVLCLLCAALHSHALMVVVMMVPVVIN